MSNEKRGIKADFNLITILVIPIAIAINFVCGNLVAALRLPVYMDTIGTFLVALLGGPWVGLVTGVLSSVVFSLTAPTALPYAIVSGILGVAAGALARTKMFVDVKRFIISGIIVTFFGVIGTIFVVVLFFGGFDGTTNSIMIAAMITAGIPFWPAMTIGNFISEVPDKFISLLIPFLVIRGMSDRYLYKFSNGPVFIEARKKAKSRKG